MQTRDATGSLHYFLRARTIALSGRFKESTACGSYLLYAQPRRLALPHGDKSYALCSCQLFLEESICAAAATHAHTALPPQLVNRKRYLLSIQSKGQLSDRPPWARSQVKGLVGSCGGAGCLQHAAQGAPPIPELIKFPTAQNSCNVQLGLTSVLHCESYKHQPTR